MEIDRSLRLASWNIHMAIGRDGRRDVERIAEVIKIINPDIIGLQEVDNHVTPDTDDLKTLSRLTNLQFVSGPTMLKTTGQYGNALMTHLPIINVERHEISVRGREPRGVLMTDCDWGGERICIAVTHLGLSPRERRTQVRQLIDIISSKSREPLVLLGDFNEWHFWGRPLRWLHRHFGRRRSPATFPATFPVLRLDHILSDPADRLDSITVVKNNVTRVASDHLPLTARFR